MEVLFGDIRHSLPLTVHAFDSGGGVHQKHWRSLPLPNFSNRTCKCADERILDRTSLCNVCSSKQMVFFPKVSHLSALLVMSAPQCRHWTTSALPFPEIIVFFIGKLHFPTNHRSKCLPGCLITCPAADSMACAFVSAHPALTFTIKSTDLSLHPHWRWR